MNQQLDPDVYDDEAFIGTEEGEIEGQVVDDLNDDGTLPPWINRYCADVMFHACASGNEDVMLHITPSVTRRALQSTAGTATRF